MFSLLGNVFVLNLDGRDLKIKKEMPKWVTKQAGIKFFKKKTLNHLFILELKFANLVCIKLAWLLRFKKIEIDPVGEIKPINSGMTFPEESETEVSYEEPQLQYLQSIHTILRNFLKEHQSNKLEQARELKYRFAAIVMDEFFFYLSIVYFLITFCSIVLAVPSFYKLN